MRAPLRVLMARTEDAGASRLLERIEELEARLAEAAPKPLGHVLFVPTAGRYEIVESEEEAPPPGQLLLLPEGYYRVSGTRPSPFPGDPRPCLTLEPVR